jgi:transcriptional regulator with XRE-family HTH domain
MPVAAAPVARAASADRPPVGTLLREWRLARRRSQLDLALDAGVSARHLSFVETGRSRPSREMVLLLADQLDVPLRDRNHLLLAAGYAPVYGRRALDHPDMAPVRDAIDRLLRGHEPFPAAVVDRTWNLVAANHGIGLLTQGVAAHLLEPPANALRLALHPEGMAPRIANLAEWRAHLLDGVNRQFALTGDPALAELHEELRGYPGGGDDACHRLPAEADIFVPLRLRSPYGELSFFGTVATFGTAVDANVAELAIESFFPADAATAEAVRAHAGELGVAEVAA